MSLQACLRPSLSSESSQRGSALVCTATAKQQGSSVHHGSWHLRTQHAQRRCVHRQTQIFFITQRWLKYQMVITAFCPSFPSARTMAKSIHPHPASASVATQEASSKTIIAKTYEEKLIQHAFTFMFFEHVTSRSL
eukprot:1148431-Pelagomonas_calceolata.AAC.2